MGFAEGLDVGRRSADEHALARDSAPDDAGPIIQRAGTDRHIETILDEIGEAVAERQVQLQRWMAPREREQDRRDAVPAEMRGHRHPQFPARFGQLVGCQRIGRLRFRQHDPAALVIGAPEIGQALPARGAVDEAHTEPLLEEANMLADHRPRKVKSRRGGRERAEVDGFHEHFHAFEAIHIENLPFRLFCLSSDLSALHAIA